MLRRTMWVAAALVLVRCGFHPVDEAQGRVEAPVVSDAGVAAANVPDAGQRDAGVSVGLDAGPAGWCGSDQGGCLADGWEYDQPGHCCLGRQTCKSLNRDAGVMGYCEY